MAGVIERFNEDKKQVLVAASWAPQELHRCYRHPDAEPPLPVLPSLSCEDPCSPPSSTMRCAAKRDLYASPCPEGVSRDVLRLYRKSRVTTPLLWHSAELPAKAWTKASDADGEPCASIRALAASVGSAVETCRLSMVSEQARVACMAKLRACVDSGDWLIVTESAAPHHPLYREIGRLLTTLGADAAACPRREFFRLWVVVETQPNESIDINTHVDPFFPRIFVQNVLLSVKRRASGAGAVCKKRKIVKPLPSDPFGHPEFWHGLGREIHRRSRRTQAGRDSDSESDDEVWDDPGCAVGASSGVCFVRAQERAESSAALRIEQIGEGVVTRRLTPPNGAATMHQRLRQSGEPVAAESAEGQQQGAV